MKKIIILLFVVFASLLNAEENTEVKEGPCNRVMDACKAADYAKGDHNMKRSLFKDCMQPLLAEGGDAVPGVTVDAQALAACKKIKDAKKTK